MTVMTRIRKARALRAVLALALLWAWVLPVQGASADGIILSVCTREGLVARILLPDGTTRPVPEREHGPAHACAVLCQGLTPRRGGDQPVKP